MPKKKPRKRKTPSPRFRTKLSNAEKERIIEELESGVVLPDEDIYIKTDDAQ